MRHGFIKVAAATPVIRVADCGYNTGKIMELIDKALEQGNKLVVFPELSVTGYTCGDLFLQDTLLRCAMESVKRIAEYSKGKEIAIVVGFPYSVKGKLYNTAAVICDGKLWKNNQFIFLLICFIDQFHDSPGIIVAICYSDNRGCCSYFNKSVLH